MTLKVCKYTYLLLISSLSLSACVNNAQQVQQKPQQKVLSSVKFKPGESVKQYTSLGSKAILVPIKKVITGAEQTDFFLKHLKGKRVGIVGNQSSIISNYRYKHTHLVDSLLTLGIKITKVFSPEHGFRGKADAGETVKNGKDSKTGLPLISLYGKNKKPNKKDLKSIDIMLFDLQDVGVRFYTYISTLHYVMEACAEQNIPLILLDRPNPNAHYIDGTVLDMKYKSFVGMHPVPIVYGMTIGEYAKMINGEKWLKNGVTCNLNVIPNKNYTHKSFYKLPIKPSPNLPNATSVNLYPSLCLFEATTVSCGRGTNKQFQIYGSPYMKKSNFNFTPKPNEGAKLPKHKNKLCFGENLENTKRLSKINLAWFLKAYKECSSVKTKFWYENNLFTRLAGTKLLKKQIKQGFTEEQIRKTWQKDLEDFMKIRIKYLIYK